MAAGLTHDILNPDLDRAGLRTKFEQTGLMSIENVLREAMALALFDFLDHDMPADWWFAGARWMAGPDGICYVRNRPQNRTLIENCKTRAHAAFLENKFAHFFLRTINDHGEQCDCRECAFRLFLASGEMIDFLSQISGIDLERPEGFFASLYQSGCFLGPHDDANRGKLALVFNFTRQWQSSWGGLLTFSGAAGGPTAQALVPGFNSLTLFAVPEGGICHHVSHVIPGLPAKRLAISGWYR